MAKDKGATAIAPQPSEVRERAPDVWAWALVPSAHGLLVPVRLRLPRELALEHTHRELGAPNSRPLAAAHIVRDMESDAFRVDFAAERRR